MSYNCNCKGEWLLNHCGWCSQYCPKCEEFTSLKKKECDKCKSTNMRVAIIGEYGRAKFDYSK